MKEITIVSKNQVGLLADIANALGSVGVNIEAISAYEKNDHAVFRIVTNDITSALKILSHIPHIETTQSDILLLKLQNRPGELGKITTKLANKNINLESIYIVSKANNFTEVAVKPSAEHFEKAKTVLGIK